MVFGVVKFLDIGKVTVPSLVGLSKAEAVKVLDDLALESEVSDEVFSEDVQKGRIISTKPGGGGRISPEGVVGLVISKGPERILISNLVGITPDIASQK